MAGLSSFGDSHPAGFPFSLNLGRSALGNSRAEPVTARSIFEPASALEKARNNGAGLLGPAPPRTLNQEVALHPCDAGGRFLGDNRSIGNDVLGDAFTGLFAADDCCNARSN